MESVFCFQIPKMVLIDGRIICVSSNVRKTNGCCVGYNTYCPGPREPTLGPLRLREGENGKVFRYRPGVAQRLGRGIAVLFHDRGTRRG